MTEYEVSQPTEDSMIRAGIELAAILKMIRRPGVKTAEEYTSPRPRRLALAEMGALARAARRVAGDLVIFAVHVENTIGDRPCRRSTSDAPFAGKSDRPTT